MPALGVLYEAPHSDLKPLGALPPPRLRMDGATVT